MRPAYTLGFAVIPPYLPRRALRAAEKSLPYIALSLPVSVQILGIRAVEGVIYVDLLAHDCATQHDIGRTLGLMHASILHRGVPCRVVMDGSKKQVDTNK
jgi:hypothetical protein